MLSKSNLLYPDNGTRELHFVYRMVERNLKSTQRKVPTEQAPAFMQIARIAKVGRTGNCNYNFKTNEEHGGFDLVSANFAYNGNRLFFTHIDSSSSESHTFALV